MKLFLFLTLIIGTLTETTFGMERCPNQRRAGVPEPIQAALAPLAAHDNNRAAQRAELRPALERLNRALTRAQLEHQVYPIAHIEELTVILSTIPYDNIKTRRAFSRLKQAALTYNDTFN